MAVLRQEGGVRQVINVEEKDGDKKFLEAHPRLKKVLHELLTILILIAVVYALVLIIPIQIVLPAVLAVIAIVSTLRDSK